MSNNSVKVEMIYRCPNCQSIKVKKYHLRCPSCFAKIPTDLKQERIFYSKTKDRFKNSLGDGFLIVILILGGILGLNYAVLFIEEGHLSPRAISSLPTSSSSSSSSSSQRSSSSSSQRSNSSNSWEDQYQRQQQRIQSNEKRRIDDCLIKWNRAQMKSFRQDYIPYERPHRILVENGFIYSIYAASSNSDTRICSINKIRELGKRYYESDGGFYEYKIDKNGNIRRWFKDVDGIISYEKIECGYQCYLP